MPASTEPKYVYAGATRWGGGGSKSAKPDTLGGVFRMKLGEYRWEHVVNGFPDVVHVHCITVHPKDKNVLFAGTQDGPYRSTDRGDHWERMRFSPRDLQVWSIAVHPGDPRIMFAGTSPVGVYRSTDGGDSWSPVREVKAPDRLQMGTFVNRVMRIAIDPSKPEEMYASLEVNGAMRSLDGGATWTDCGDSLVSLSERPELKSKILTPFESEGMLDAHAICISARRPGGPIVATRMGLFGSSDRGSHWEDLRVKRFSPMTYGRDIRVSPHDPATLYACLSESSQGSTGSVCKSTDFGATWKRFDHSVQPKSTVMAVALHPDDPNVVFYAARQAQVFGTEDGGKTWREHAMPSGCKGVYAIASA
jgi:photosystem II stability/assembly factor-like uncharacterized protein